jgi:hypothetical protein
LLLLGAFGALFSAKHYERFSFHMERARGYRDALERFLPNTQIKAMKQAADDRTRDEFPRLYDLRIFRFWVARMLSSQSSARFFSAGQLVRKCAVDRTQKKRGGVSRSPIGHKAIKMLAKANAGILGHVSPPQYQWIPGFGTRPIASQSSRRSKLHPLNFGV